MAVDYGDSRTGVAVSDLSNTLVGDAWVIHNKQMQETARLIADEAISREVSLIVIGYPKNMDGSTGPRAEKSSLFAETIRKQLPDEAHDMEIKLWDERLTTVSAHRVLSDVGKYGKKRKQTVDAVAAALILEGYLQSIASTSLKTCP